MAKHLNLDEGQYVVFRLGRETYGLDISTVLEIITMQPITQVPGTEDCIEGIINLRGRVIPVLNLHRKFSLSGDGVTRNTRIIVVELEGLSIGMVVDEVSEVVMITKSCIEQPSNMLADISVEYLAGVANLDGKLVIILDLGKVLKWEDSQMLESIG